MTPPPILRTMTQPPLPYDTERAEHWLADMRDAAASQDDATAERISALLADPAMGPFLAAVAADSPFLGRMMVRDVAALPGMLSEDPDAALSVIIGDAAHAAREAGNIEALMADLRGARRHACLLIALADLAQAWTVAETTRALTVFADAAIDAAIHWLLNRAVASGELEVADPDSPGRVSGLTIIGMGKAGAYELNYSSDVDLIAFFEPDKARYTGRKTAQACFIRIVQDLVKILQTPTGDGHVLRVDLRLRPDPGATPVVISTHAAENYYESMGQNWERAAMIKARPLAGDLEVGQRFLEHLSPFIWRRNLDYAAIQDVHSIKRQIHSHRGHGRLAIEGHNIKLGRGGIRDIEFFAQTQQLIAGGREPGLRQSGTCEALMALAGAGWIESTVAEEMTEAYWSHRRLEHRLQMIGDEQTHSLPDDADGIDHVARFSGYADTAEFRSALMQRMSRVERHYAKLFEAEPELTDQGNLVFTGGDDDPDTLKTLAAMGFDDAPAVSATIRGWHHARYRATRTARSRELLTNLMPTLLRAIAATPSPDATLVRFDRFLGGLPAGIQLFSMLTAQPQLLTLLAEMLGSAPRLSDYLSRNAGVLDAVLSEDFFDPMPPREVLLPGLEQSLRLAGDYQDVLDAVRRWTKERKFQLGVQALSPGADADQIGEGLACVAECAIAGLFPHVLNDFVEREEHGTIPGGGMAIVALGKLGSREMTETSDLDLVFIYDVPDIDGEQPQSDGRRPLSAAQYYARLSQRLINAITALTGEGRLYEVDMRLRPSGNAGPVATRLAGFVAYHGDQSWTWEHMALTRARVIAGPEELAAATQLAIGDVVRRRRDPDETAKDVRDMRARIAREKGAGSLWGLKLARGGLLDIEFIAQYLQLIHGADHPQALDPQTAVALRGLAAAGVLPEAQASTLIEAWRFQRGLLSVLRVAVGDDFDRENMPDGVRTVLMRASAEASFDHLEQRLSECQANVQEIFDRIIGPL